MALSITGGQQLITSDLQRTFRDATAQAKKQLEETGSLQGFSKEFATTSAEGTVTIEISAMASALYDRSADGDDYLLAYKVTDKPYYSDGGVGISSGASETINAGADIDTFLASAESAFGLMRWATVIDGTPEELAAYDAAELAKSRAQPGYVELQATGAHDAAGAAGAGAETRAPKASVDLNSKLAKAKAQNDSANQLVAKLTDFLDGLKGKPQEPRGGTAKSADDSKSVQTVLSRLLARADLTI